MSGPCLAIFVVDVLERSRLERLWARGEAGFLAALARRGGIRELTGRDLFAEHGTAWTLFSGVSRRVHGHHDFRQIRPGSYDIVGDEIAACRDVQPFWWRLGGQTRLLVVDAPETVPLPGLAGIQAADWLTTRAASIRRRLAVEPAAQARGFHGPASAAAGGAEYRRHATLAQDRRLIPRLLEELRRKADVCRGLAEELRPEVVVIGFQQSHTAAHRFWRHRRGGPPDLIDAIDEVYRDTDAALASIAAALPEDADILVASLFDMVDLYPTAGLSDSFCRILGYHAVDAVAARWRLRNVLPRHLREEIGWWLPSRLQESIEAAGLNATTAWSGTRAFSTSTLYTTSIRVNLLGREPMGIVRPGDDYEALLDDIAADLRSLVDADTGLPAIASIVLPSRHYDCGPHALLPDVVAEWTPRDSFRDTVLHPRAVLTQPRPQYDRDSYHTWKGFVIGAGPRLATAGGPVDLLDVAPSCLTLLGRAVPPTLEGTPSLAR